MKNVIKKSSEKKLNAVLKKAGRCFYVYMLESENGSLYTGYTVDINARWKKHYDGKGARFTRAFKPVRIAACWKVYGVKGDAMRIEAFIKKLKKQEKDEIVKFPKLLTRHFADKKRIDLLSIKRKVYKVKIP